MAKRKKIFAANWKMNKTRDDALSFIYEVNTAIPKSDTFETVLFTPSIYLRSLVKRQEDMKIGAQNMHYLDKGAYTGEISADMLTNIGVSYVLIGHSERRTYFNEKDGEVNLKVKKALEKGLIPVVCVGEDLKTRDSGKTNQFLETQVKIALMGIEEKDIPNVVIAYEPIWAIGSGKVAEPKDANDAILFIREQIKKLYNKKVADKVRILYGGSVSPGNLPVLLEQPEIDGALVGGASLKVDSFLALANTFLAK